MTPDGSGRHCAVCEKTVVDFGRKDPAEILAYLAQPGRENACGRFRSTQLPGQLRLLTLRAAPRLAASLAAVLALTHCTPDAPIATPTEPLGRAVQDGQLVRGKVLDCDTHRPVAGALIICEADTLRQTRAAVDGSFSLLVPPHLSNTKLIACLPEQADPQRQEEDWLMPYVPHYFSAGEEVTVLLRRPPMVIGRTRLEPGETFAPAVAQYLGRCAALPPPPKLSTIKFMPPTPVKPVR